MSETELHRAFDVLGHFDEPLTQAVIEHCDRLAEIARRAAAILATPGCPGREALAAEIAQTVPPPRRDQPWPEHGGSRW